MKRYVEQVARFQHVKTKYQREDFQVWKDDYAKIDASRRRAHESLLDTLQETGKVIGSLQRAVKEETGEQGVPLSGYPSRAGERDGNIIFDGAVLRERNETNRNLVRDWAIAAWAVEQVRTAKKKAAGSG